MVLAHLKRSRCFCGLVLMGAEAGNFGPDDGLSGEHTRGRQWDLLGMGESISVLPVCVMQKCFLEREMHEQCRFRWSPGWLRTFGRINGVMFGLLEGKWGLPRC